jgi:uncharacterized protein (DUF885 family)
MYRFQNLFKNKKLMCGFIFSFLLSFLIFFNCAVKESSEDRKFSDLVDRFMDWYFMTSPVSATNNGAHQYDGELEDFSSEGILAKGESLRFFLQELNAIDTTQLSFDNKMDFKILGDEIEWRLFQLEVLKPWEKSPLMYNYIVGGGIYSLISRDFAPLEQRLGNAISRLRKIPRLLNQAKANLKNPPEIFTQTVIKQNKGTINLIKNDLIAAAGKVPALKDSIIAESKNVVMALEYYQNFLENDLLPRSKGDFRLGEKLYKKKLKFTLNTDLESEEIVRRAEEEFKRVKKEMYETALPLHQEFFPERELEETGEKLEDIVVKEVLDEIAKDQPEPDELVEVCRDILKDLTQFVKDKDLIDLSGINPVKVDWEPEFSRGVAIAGLDSPGPLDKDMESYYRVSPIPDDWTPGEAESYLREYNNWMLIDLSIHEAMPGHYVQLYFSNQCPSMVRAIFGNGPFIEGWAIFSEWMIADQGFKNSDPRLELTRLKMYLRAVTNAILDAGLHTGKMTDQEAMKLMVEGAFQEESEAKGKLIRAKLTSTQLSTYFVGFQEVFNLYQDYKKERGKKFSLKEFNRMLLSHGSPPTKYLREIILGG